MQADSVLDRDSMSMEKITLFAQNLVVIVIIVSALLNLTTGEKYDKYLRFVVGLMIVFYTVSTLMGFAADLNITDFSVETGTDGGVSLEETERKRDEMINRSVLSSYETSILYSLKASGYDATRVVCSYEDGSLSVTFFAATSNNLAGIKKYINDFYHVESSHIYGYTEAEDE